MSTRIVEVRARVMKQNDLLAHALRERFQASGVSVVGLVSSPGSGKTAFLEKILGGLAGDFRVAALVGDLATENDAARLKRALVAAHNGERDIVEAIRDYEAGMLDYGFRAVRNSLKAMHQTVTDSRPSLTLSRLTLRAINALPPVKRRVARRLGEE